MNNIYLLVAGMLLSTYIPRLLPFLLLSKLKLSKRLSTFLTLVPYAALGALIVPGAFEATPQLPLASVLGIGFAAVFSWYRNNIIVSVLGSVLVTFLTLYFLI